VIKLSLVIPVLNSHEVVRRQLLHFEKMVLHDDTEIILVDDGSDPPIENTSNRPIIIHRTNDTRPWTWALARNAGARIASGEYLLMYDLDHIVPAYAINFIRAFQGLKVQFVRDFGVLDEHGDLKTDRKTLTEYGLPETSGKGIGPLPNNFAMRRDLFWELGGYREDLIGRPYPQGEDRAWRSTWRTYELAHGGEGSCVSEHRPKIYMFPNGKYLGDVDADPKGLFHGLSRKNEQNFWYRQQKRGNRA
jgi:glycosyltransferase involved in cell wall biosynthesis